MDANTEYLARAIEAELRRLDALDVGAGGVAVCVDDDLPEGWIRIADEGERTYGLACDFLEVLKATNPEDGTDDDGQPSGWFAAWQAISNFGHPQFRGYEPGPKEFQDFHEFVHDIDGTEGLGLVVLRTNAGLRYGFAPTDEEFAAFNSTHDYSDRYETAEAAMEAAREFVAMEKMRDTLR